MTVVLILSAPSRSENATADVGSFLVVRGRLAECKTWPNRVPVQIRVISARQNIPARYLEQIFQRLRRARIVASKRGPGGGYTLARPASEITLRQIVEAVEGPLPEALEMPPADKPIIDKLLSLLS